MSVKPKRLSDRMRKVMKGSPPTSTSGLGRPLARGPRRVPFPPASITACTGPSYVQQPSSALSYALLRQVIINKVPNGSATHSYAIRYSVARREPFHVDGAQPTSVAGFDGSGQRYPKCKLHNINLETIGSTDHARLREVTSLS